jgi:hypothetical protein
MHWLLLGFLLLGAFGVEVGVGSDPTGTDSRLDETQYGGTGLPPSKGGMLYGGTGLPPSR